MMPDVKDEVGQEEAGLLLALEIVVRSINKASDRAFDGEGLTTEFVQVHWELLQVQQNILGELDRLRASKN